MAATMKQNTGEDDATFLTGIGNSKENLDFSADDIVPSKPWRAHTDGVSWVTYIEDLDLISSCSFDKNVFIWDIAGDNHNKVGSLVLGMKAVPPGMELDNDQKRFRASWKITDKILRLKE